MNTIYFPTRNGAIITLNNVIYTPQCDSNLISPGQLQELGIIYHNHPDYMILKQRSNTLRSASRLKNLFIFNTKTTKKMIIV